MPRPKAFAEQDALHAAMETFWQKGYHLTSMQDLVEAMGINRGSMYDTFGDKHTLYKLALGLYQDILRADLTEVLAIADSPVTKIRAVFDWSVQEAHVDRYQRGCFMTNATLEMLPHYSDVAPLIDRHFQFLGTLFRSLLHEAIDRAECRPALPVDETAQFLVSQFVGLRVLSKTNPAAGTLEAVVRMAMGVL
jgi:TetR/AcrR family transcriptional regulator, transcriptional repressor for nem operon